MCVQLIRDMLNVSEMNLRSPVSLSVGKYRSLRCGIEVVPPETPEFRRVVARLSDKYWFNMCTLFCFCSHSCI